MLEYQNSNTIITEWTAQYDSFTPVCTTELGELAMMHYEFKNRGVKVCGFSCNSRKQHKLWIRDIKHVTGSSVTFPMFCDPTREHAMRLGVLDKHHVDYKTGRPLSVRGVYLLYPKTKEVALMTIYPNSSGRNMDEILRSVEAVQLSYQNKVVTPSGWRPGLDVLVDLSLTDAEAAAAFGAKDLRCVAVPSEQNQKNIVKTHYMRYVPAPPDPPPFWKQE